MISGFLMKGITAAANESLVSAASIDIPLNGLRKDPPTVEGVTRLLLENLSLALRFVHVQRLRVHRLCEATDKHEIAFPYQTVRGSKESALTI